MRLNLLLSRWKDVFQRLAGKGIYPYELAFLLDNPIRKLILSPGKFADRLHLSDRSLVLEIGSGPGYFSCEVSKRIPDGRLIIFDIQSEMLKKSKIKLERKKISNAIPVQGNAIALPFHAVFDVAFLVTVLGEISDTKKCLNSISKILRTGSILSITEMKGDPDALTHDEIQDLANRCGFEYLETYHSFKGFTINFKKTANL